MKRLDKLRTCKLCQLHMFGLLLTGALLIAGYEYAALATIYAAGVFAGKKLMANTLLEVPEASPERAEGILHDYQQFVGALVQERRDENSTSDAPE